MAQAPKKAMKKVLHVHCPHARFRRGGREFSRGKNVVALDELTEEQVKAIKAEPALAVTEGEIEDDAQSEGGE